MNYEKAYKEALERAVKIHSKERVTGIELVTCEDIFPELRESEDEKIRKLLIEWVKEFRKLNPTNADHNAECSEAIAWLEKQGEQKSVKPEQSCYHNDGLYYAIDILEKTFGKVEGYQSDDGIIEHQTAIETVNALYHKNPTWSEEDEKILNTIINDIQERHPEAMWKISIGSTVAVSTEYIIDWLNKKMFDYRGLIEKGLALEATKEMYDIKTK